MAAFNRVKYSDCCYKDMPAKSQKHVFFSVRHKSKDHPHHDVTDIQPKLSMLVVRTRVDMTT